MTCFFEKLVFLFSTRCHFVFTFIIYLKFLSGFSFPDRQAPGKTIQRLNEYAYLREIKVRSVEKLSYPLNVCSGGYFLKRRTQTKFFFPSNTRFYQNPPPLRKFWGYKSLSTLLTFISLRYAFSLSRWIVLRGTGQSGKVKPERILK